MNRYAFLFGGQGTETPRMGLELPAAVPLLRRAGELAGVDALALLERGGPDFARTAVIQPLLVAVGLGAAAALAARGIAPAFVAGHSLGEIAAWSVAGAFTADQALALAATRGRAMEREALRHPGGMLAVSACDDAKLAELVRIGSAHGSVVVAAHNAPGEHTLSGDRGALDAIAARTAVTRLPVAGSWHSPAMSGAITDVHEAARCASHARRAGVIANRTGELATAADDVADLLAGQLVRPVQWTRTLATLAADGVTDYVVLGPGKLMRSLVQKNVGARVRVHVIETPADIEGMRA